MARTSSDLTECRPPVRKTPCCPDCGALECLCRPRFFAGQLLSEQDLNRLDQYIKNKNRLHNRHQHGWGVVNGLLVLCDPCGDVKVTQGYAVDPCGDDIVVCEDTRVNLCELIRKCKQAEPQPECQPFRHPPNANCSDLEEEWVLTIKYHEWASRGVTALRGNTCGVPGATSCGPGGCGAGCTCGGSGEPCGCANGAGKSAKSPGWQNPGAETALKNRGAPQQCEATVTCEGYSFGVYQKPPDEPDDDDDRLFRLEGAFWDVFLCCAQPLMDAIPPMPDLRTGASTSQQGNAIAHWCCRFRDNLLKYFLTQRSTNCEIIDHLRAIQCPNINDSDNVNQNFMQSYLQLLAAWAEGIKNCLCLALLSPPPQATCDVRVPLATVRIRARDCRVLSICNWTTERKIMVTWPAVAHWLSILPIGAFIRQLLDRLCCNSLLNIFDRVLEDMSQRAHVSDTSGMMANNNRDAFAQAMHLASGEVAARFSPDLGAPMNSFSMLAEGVAARGDQPLELGAWLNAVSPRFKLPDNGQTLNAVEARNLPLLVVLEVAIRPLLSSFMGSRGAAERIAEFERTLGGEVSAARASMSSVEMQRQLDELRETLRQQEEQIKTLMERLNS